MACLVAAGRSAFRTKPTSFAPPVLLVPPLGADAPVLDDVEEWSEDHVPPVAAVPPLTVLAPPVALAPPFAPVPPLAA